MKFAELRDRYGAPIFVNPAAVAFVAGEEMGGARVHFDGGATTPVLAGEAAEVVEILEAAVDDAAEPDGDDRSNPDGATASGGLPLGGGKAVGAKK